MPWEHKVGDFVFYSSSPDKFPELNGKIYLVLIVHDLAKTITIQSFGYSPIEIHKKWSGNIPIWSQGQLQDMVDNNLKVLCAKFCIFLKGAGPYNHDFKSMEQLWLAFVMYEKYQKKWNGSDWG